MSASLTSCAVDRARPAHCAVPLLALTSLLSVSALDASALADRGVADDPFADVVIDYVPGDGASPGYTTPETALGSPARFTGGVFEPMAVSIFNPAWRPDEIVSIGAGGSLTVAFETPVEDDPLNPFGVDLIVFGNALFVTASAPGVVISDPAQLTAEGGVIELSPDGLNWFAVPGLEADGRFPTEGYLDLIDPYAVEPGIVPSDFTLPVDPSLELSDFDGLQYEEALRLYAGSGGGTGVDIASVGLASVTHVRISNPASPGTGAPAPEVDGFADVAPRLPGDLSGDFIVDAADLFILLGDWGPTQPAAWPSDLDRSGVVDSGDLFILLGAWGG
jgi:hypothetical protein